MIYLENSLINYSLIFALIFILVFEALKRTLKEKQISAVIALCLSAIATFYFSYSQIKLIENIYSFWGIAFLFLIPFAIIFLFIYSTNISGVLRKIIWVAYGTTLIIILQKNKIPVENSEVITPIILAIIIILVIADSWIKSTITTNKNLRIPQSRR
jgi:xanthine/uracil permease